MKRRKEDERREAIVAEYLEGDESYRELEARYGVSSSTLHNWVQKSQLGSETAGRGDARGAGQVVEETDAGAEIKRLRQELRQVELHNKLLNAMIDIAEEQMGVKIRKKPGAKQ
jgi:transposase-like protein